MAERQAMPSDVLLRDYAYSTHFYRARVSEGETLEVVKRPDFWAHCTKLLKIADRVEILADDGSWEWQGRVIKKVGPEVYLRETFLWQSDGSDVVAPPKPDNYIVEWAGPAHKWRISSGAGANVLKHSFEDKSSAEQYLADHLAGRLKNAA